MRGRDVAELRAFAAVAEHESFARAAAHLGMTPSALSQTIRTLEDRLGVRLLNRTTRSVAISDAGASLLARILPALAELDVAVDDLTRNRESPHGVLRLNVTRDAALHYIAPLIAPFSAACPAVMLDITVDDRLVDIVAGGFDAGVRLGETVARDMIAIRLGGAQRMMVVAAAAYLDRHGTPSSPRDLGRHRCLNYRWPTSGAPYRWEFSRDGEALTVAVPGPVITNAPDMLVRAALDGAGIGCFFADLVRDHVAAGRLRHLLAAWSPPFPGFYLYHPSRRQVPPALRAFIDFIMRPQG
ncbi:LysR family transcriptional regulator [Tistrella bauzanensis]|uniref:LysR family transcriptional regulator n=1 Tax=Tistrella bauzanensis TaxID=657419 RepID=A0ABQ1IB01_9PROT|nr:LysR family transcriptional regulator [Tistrella bauzanensis]GGB29910.1 LysR family transcriptional regulator [Tistrella bauzanensis]